MSFACTDGIDVDDKRFVTVRRCVCVYTRILLIYMNKAPSANFYCYRVLKFNSFN